MTDSQSKKTKKNRKNKSMTRRVLTIASIVIGVLLIGAGSYAGFLINKADSAIHRMSANSNGQSPLNGNATAEDEEIEAGESIKPVTFLLAGVDSRDGSGGAMNTDVLMLVAFNPDTRSASMLSIPRDLLMKTKSLPSRKANYYYPYFYIKDKETVIPNVKQFFSDQTGLPLDHMAVVNFDVLRQVVDALGGLEIDVDMDMKYVDKADGTSIDLKKGLQKLDGQGVLDFVRYRKSNQGTRESSDFARNQRQQIVIKQIVDKLGTLNGMTQWGKILDIIGDNVKTDVPESDLRQWVLNFPKIKPNTIRSLQLEAQWSSPFVYANADDLRQALSALRSEVGLAPDTSLRVEDVFGIMK
ncbi:LytR family transcriptional regulator [Cohnella terricola]|uniref:LytR family transcriptional regulator n=2 Tax=Cohnella terricola TaxID=1289167 RepID=A0A559JTZ8_9BACL|nr:LytR family transcriptional regulator [Cohnella terricola]